MCACTPDITGAAELQTSSEHPETSTQTPTTLHTSFIMAQIFTVSDNESENSEDIEDQTHERKSPQRSQERTMPDRLRGEKLVRQRNHSINEEDLLETGTREEDDMFWADGFRRRTHSAPPALWAAKKYGQQLRRMSDEFDNLLDKGMKRVSSAGTSRQMRQSPSWLALLWSHKESDAESHPQSD